MVFKKIPIMILTVLTACTSPSVQPTQSDPVIEPAKDTQSPSYPDTASIAKIFIETFSLPDSSTVTVTKIDRNDAGKYVVLAEMKELRKKIKWWNDQIAALQYIGNDHPYYNATWYADIEDHADMAYHVNKLQLEYDEKIEMLAEASYLPAAAFYEAKVGKHTFWVVLGPQSEDMGHFRID